MSVQVEVCNQVNTSFPCEQECVLARFGESDFLIKKSLFPNGLKPFYIKGKVAIEVLESDPALQALKSHFSLYI